MSATATPRVRVLHVITRLDAGGAAMNTILSAELLRAQGFDATIFHGRTHDPDGRIAADLARRGLTAVGEPALVREVSPLRDLRAVLSLRRYLRAQPHDLVHTHQSKGGAVGRVAARLAGLPVVHTAHGHIFYGYFSPVRTWVFVKLEQWLARISGTLISLTDAETADGLARGIGRPEQYRTVPSGVPLAQFRNLSRADGLAFRQAWGIPGEALVYVSVGRLTAVKGFDLLLRAFAGLEQAAVPPWLVLVGEGEERAALEALAGALGVAGRTRFIGQLADVRPALAAADVFVLASRNEGMGRALVEAMAAGLAVIGTRVGGVPEVVRAGETGLLAEPESVPALRAAMQACAASPARRLALGVAAASSVYPAYDVGTMIERLAAIYRAALVRRPHPAIAPAV